jgi:hypothetical protein
MKAYVDIENSKTKQVNTLEVDVINLDFINNDINNLDFDISNLTKEELIILRNAINPTLRYTDIELFYIDEDSTPFFGPDYTFSIDDGHLNGKMRKDK